MVGCFSAQRKWCHRACSNVLEQHGWIHDLITSAGLTCGSLELEKWYVRDSAVVMQSDSSYHSSDFRGANPLRDGAFCSWQKPRRRGQSDSHFDPKNLQLRLLEMMFIKYCFLNNFATKNVIASWICSLQNVLVVCKRNLWGAGAAFETCLYNLMKKYHLIMTLLLPSYMLNKLVKVFCWVFNWLGNSLNLIPMPLYDLNKQTRLTARSF